jgi:hypothetical protein
VRQRQSGAKPFSRSSPFPAADRSDVGPDPGIVVGRRSAILIRPARLHRRRRVTTSGIFGGPALGAAGNATISRDTAILHAASESLSLCSVKCGTALNCASTNSRCGSSLQVRRSRGTAGCAHALGSLHYLDGAISYCLPIVLQLSPDAIALAASVVRGFRLILGNR